MRKIIAFTHATLDGYIDEPHKWSFQYSTKDLQADVLQMTRRADALHQLDVPAGQKSRREQRIRGLHRHDLSDLRRRRRLRGRCDPGALGT